MERTTLSLSSLSVSSRPPTKHPAAFIGSHQPWAEISIPRPRVQLSLSPEEEEKEADSPEHEESLLLSRVGARLTGNMAKGRQA